MSELYGVAVAAAVVLVTLGALRWYVPRKFARDDRARRAVPAAAVRDLVAETRVRVIGTAHGVVDPVTGPHSGKPCLAYRARVLDPDLRPHETSGVVAFRVTDETGSIEVEVEHVKLDLAPDLKPDDSFGAGIIKRNLAANAGTQVSLHVASLWEHALRPDGRVAVIARVVRNDRGELVLAGTASEPVELSTWHASLEP